MEKKEIKISVIVITYNQEATIGRTLDSILSQQTEVPYEIIIGDDCSSDKTWEICRSYAERHPDKIRYFRRQKNLGVVGNYFQCIADSRGEYLADCAGDDFWVDTLKLRKQYELMDSDPEISMVYTDWLCCNLDGSDVRLAPMYRNRERSGRTVWGYGELLLPFFRREPDAFVHLCSAMYRADIIKAEVSRHPEVYVVLEYGCEDFQIVAAMAAFGKVVRIPEVMMHYSISEDSVSHQTDFRKKYRQVKGALDMVRRLSGYFGIQADSLHEYYSVTIDYLCAQLFHSGSSELLRDYRKFIDESQLERYRSPKTIIRENLMKVPAIWKPVRAVAGRKKSR